VDLLAETVRALATLAAPAVLADPVAPMALGLATQAAPMAQVVLVTSMALVVWVAQVLSVQVPLATLLVQVALSVAKALMARVEVIVPATLLPQMPLAVSVRMPGTILSPWAVLEQSSQLERMPLVVSVWVPLVTLSQSVGDLAVRAVLVGRLAPAAAWVIRLAQVVVPLLVLSALPAMTVPVAPVAPLGLGKLVGQLNPVVQVALQDKPTSKVQLVLVALAVQVAPAPMNTPTALVALAAAAAHSNQVVLAHLTVPKVSMVLAELPGLDPECQRNLTCLGMSRAISGTASCRLKTSGSNKHPLSPLAHRREQTTHCPAHSKQAELAPAPLPVQGTLDRQRPSSLLRPSDRQRPGNFEVTRTASRTRNKSREQGPQALIRSSLHIGRRLRIPSLLSPP